MMRRAHGGPHPDTFGASLGVAFVPLRVGAASAFRISTTKLPSPGIVPSQGHVDFHSEPAHQEYHRMVRVQWPI
eukprot:1302363-Amphidinium_carterae.1